jgi:DAK2 domain fusion protein YloV
MVTPKTSGVPNPLNGDAFRRLVEAGALCVEQHAESINALNVFPVPDGDTGTNMLLTLRSAASAPELPQRGTGTVAEVSSAIARGALLGARGNSGVIFSQFLKGLASGLSRCVECDGRTMRLALGVAAEAAYQAVGTPVEGTMLTVMRAAAQGVQSPDSALPLVWEQAYQAAQAALILTPEQLPVLKQAGVVDAGGQGVVAFMAGAWAFLRGHDSAVLEIAAPGAPITEMASGTVSHEYLGHTEDDLYGYCTQFVIRGQALDLEALRAQVMAIASSTVVVGDDAIARVHAHASEPGPLLSLGAGMGSLEQIKIENMDTMHQEFMARHGYGATEVPVAVVAVASGDGLERVFRELGAGVVQGGQTMNPSAAELLQAAKRAFADHVLLLPNNPNILLAARQAQELDELHCTVVPTRSIPQGIAAVLAFNPDLDAEANVQVMTTAMQTVCSGEVTTAIRDSAVDGVSVAQGQAIALLDGTLIAAAETPHLALMELLRQAGPSDGALITLYWGADADQASASTAADQVRNQWPGSEVDVVPGGQPHYHYLVSIE